VSQSLDFDQKTSLTALTLLNQIVKELVLSGTLLAYRRHDLPVNLRVPFRYL